MPLKKGLFIKPNLSLEGEECHGSNVSIVCPHCKKTQLVFTVRENLFICPLCGHYLSISARERINMIADKDSFEEILVGISSKNLISFPGYDEKLEKSKNESGETEGVVTGTCRIGGIGCAIFVMEALFLMGSMGTVVGDKITYLFEYAVEHRLPVVGFTVSGGARMQEGILSLMQMAKTSGAVKKHGDAGLFYLTVLTNPTTGGVTASFAMQGDIIISEPGALIAFAGPRVIKQTMRQKLPEGFQRAEFLLEKGFVDSIVERKDQKNIIAMLLGCHVKEKL